MLNRFFSSPVFRVSIRYGAISAVLCLAMVISMFYMHRHPFLVNPFFDFRVFVFALLLFFSLKEIREFYQDGYLSFWQGIAACAVFLTTSALISGSGVWSFGTLQPAFVSEFITQFDQQIRSFPADEVERMGKDVIERNLKALSATTIGDLAKLYARQTFQIGLFISIIISLILRRSPKTE